MAKQIGTQTPRVVPVAYHEYRPTRFWNTWKDYKYI